MCTVVSFGALAADRHRGCRRSLHFFVGPLSDDAHTHRKMKIDLLWLATVLFAFILLAEPAAADAGALLLHALCGFAG